MHIDRMTGFYTECNTCLQWFKKCWGWTLFDYYEYCQTSNKEISLTMLKWRIGKEKALFSNQENKKKIEISNSYFLIKLKFWRLIYIFMELHFVCYMLELCQRLNRARLIFLKCCRENLSFRNLMLDRILYCLNLNLCAFQSRI